MSQKNVIDSTTRIIKTSLGIGIMIREFCTIHNSTLEDKCKIYERVSIKKSYLHSGCDINAGTYIENATLYEDVQVAPNCVIVGVTHKFSSTSVSHEDIFEKIIIEKGVWIGAGVIILPGANIGEGAVIGAGAIVRNAIPSHFKYVGTPLNPRLEKI